MTTARAILIPLSVFSCTAAFDGRADADIGSGATHCSPKVQWDGSLGIECASDPAGEPPTDGQNADTPPQGWHLPLYGGDPPVLYRAYSRSSGNHLYSIYPDEINHAMWDYGYGGYEGVVGRCWGAPVAGTVPIYRLSNGSHQFYTSDWNEKHAVETSNIGFSYDGVTCYIKTHQEPGTCPFYRMSIGNNNHFYTTSWNEVAQVWNMAGSGANYEGIIGYLAYDGACPN